MPNIYIKTDMMSMPKGCLDCDYAVNGYTDEVRCLKTDNVIPTEYDNERRPEWCPLIEMKEER